MLVFFLCARRHDVDETLQLLTRYHNQMIELGFDKDFPNSHTPLFQSFIANRAGLHVPGARDKHDRMVYVFWMRRNTPQPFKAMMCW
jgi:hypothetical protein